MKNLAILWTLLVMITVSILWFNFKSTEPVKATGYTEVHVGGVLKVDESGQWYLLTGSGHMPQGITGVSQDNTFIYVDYDWMDYVFTVSVDEDESFPDNISCGASVGRDQTKIKCWKDGQVVNPNTLYTLYRNLWFNLYGLNETE